MAEIEVTEIENDLNIDKNNLDVECMDQARRFMKWSVDYAEAVRVRDEAKRKASIVKSNINLDVRSRPDEYGLGSKPTVDSVSAIVDSHEEVNKAETMVSDAQYAVNIFGAAKEALDQRRAMLERLVSLYISGYYSQPKLGTEEVGRLADDATQVQKELLSKAILARRKKE
jgi:hypothetical protein